MVYSTFKGLAAMAVAWPTPAAGSTTTLWPGPSNLSSPAEARFPGSQRDAPTGLAGHRRPRSVAHEHHAASSAFWSGDGV